MDDWSWETPEEGAPEEGNRSPPGPDKYTEAELEGIIKETLIKDCKLDACIDKYLMAAMRRTGQKDPWWGVPGFEGNECSDLKDQLLADIARHVPDYFHDPQETSLDTQSSRLRKRIEARWQNWGTQYNHSESSIEQDSFHKRVLEILSEQRLRQLSSPGAPVHPQRPPSLQQSAFTEACRQLRASIEGENTSASFACGGTVLVGDTETEKPCTSPPVNIFWATGNDSHARKLVLPLNGTQESSSQLLRQLVTDCSPATFGKGDKDVLDPDYRMAGKLDPNQFSTSFHPANFGILENIEQILLPSVSTDLENCLQFRKLTAHLYKLNVYSGPSGLFRKHVDTPRSQNQIGSLVVCLPSPFNGGKLIIRHNGKEVNFDWSTASASNIQWAAFYSDCEHEIQTVTEGDRITLTYNLYVTEPVGLALLPNPLVDPKSLPLYGYMREVIEQPAFFREGGVLGFFCSHAYPHTSEHAEESLPRALKGSDLVLYSVLKSLGIEVKVLPVMEFGGAYAPEDPQLGITGQLPEKHFYLETWSSEDWSERKRLEEFRKHGYMTRKEWSDESWVPQRAGFELRYQDIDGDLHDCDDIDRHWKTMLLGRRVIGIVEEQETDKTEGARLGRRLHSYVVTNKGGESMGIDDVGSKTNMAIQLPSRHYLAYGTEEGSNGPQSDMLRKRVLDRITLFLRCNHRYYPLLEREGGIEKGLIMPASSGFVAGFSELGRKVETKQWAGDALQQLRK